MKEISTALVKAQSEMGNPVKGATNPFFKSKYADLNSVREASIPILNKYGISVLQPMVHIDGKNFIKTLLLHESGESIESHTEIIYSKLNDAQSQGSGITYARRYGLQSLVCIGADDDDGNSASKEIKPNEPKQKVEDNTQEFLDWKVEIDKCKSMEDLGVLYNKNKESIEKNSAIKVLFTNRKAELSPKK